MVTPDEPCKALLHHQTDSWGSGSKSSMRQSCIPSAAELLLKNYIQLAQEFTDAATPQGNVFDTLASDWRYERALQGVRLLAQHHVGQLVQAIIAWRQAVNEDIKKNFSSNNVVNVQGVCKRATMEILFLEAAIQVLCEFVPEFWQDQHFQSFFKSMLHVAFRWLLNDHEYVPHQELVHVRASVVQVSSKVIGVMSRIRLADVTAAFSQKMEERVSARKDAAPRADVNLLRTQALKLCAGMHSVRLSFENDAELEQSTIFLRKSHPLNYTAAVKKSQVHHAMCEMLTDVLLPLIRSNQLQSCTGLSPALLAEWYSTVLRLKNEVGQWVNKHGKHTNVGYPLVTVLVCLVDGENYTRQVESMADFLVKQMKVKEYRLLCFRCLNFLVTSSLVRNKAAASNPSVVAWLDKVVKPVLVSARKGGIAVADQQEFVSQIADLCPEYCVSSVVMELLQTDSPEAQLIALRSLHLVATSVPQHVAASLDLQTGSLRKSSTTLAVGSSTSSSMSGGTGNRRMVRLPAGAVLDLIRSGQHPFELQGIAHLLPRVQQQLGTMLTQFHRSFGAYLVFSAEAVPKDKQQQLELFRLVLRLLPYLRPEQWTSLRPLDYLSPYTAHADGAVRACARDALMSIVRGCPSLRGPVLANMAVFLAAIPDDTVQVTRECLLLLRMFMELWLNVLQEQRLSSSFVNPAAAAGSSSSRQLQAQRLLASSSQEDASCAADAVAAVSFGTDAPECADPACFTLDLHRLEGVFFMLLCSFDEAIRLEACSALGVLRTLHQQLYTMAEELGLQQRQRSSSGDTLQLQPPAAPSQLASPGMAPAGAVGGSFSSVGTPTAAAAAAAGGAADSAAAAAGAAAAATAPPASSVASGSGMFFRHKATASRDSAEFMQTLGQLETPDDEVLCVMDVLEEVGDDVARRCYWDFGDWSDLWRETKHVLSGVNLQAVMGANDEVGTLRWTRCIVELVRAASHMCPTSMGVAYLEMLHKLSRYLARDSSGRLIIPTDSVDGRRSEAWRALVVAVCVCPPSLRERVERAARKGSSFSARDLVRALLVSLTGGSAIPQQVCLMALGHCSHEHYPVLFEELPGLVEEYSRTKQRRGTAARPEEARKSVANVLRLLADAMPPGTLSTQLVMRARYLDWIRDTAFFLRQLPRFGEAFWEVSQVAYCLCAVCKCVGHELVGPMTLPLAVMRDAPSMQRANSNRSSLSEPLTPGASITSLMKTSPGAAAVAQDSLAATSIGSSAGGQAPMARKVLFEMFAAWCEEGDGEYQETLRAGISTALARLRDYDADTREGLSQELAQAAEFLDQAARLAMASMLQGPVFDTDARRAQGPVLRWIDRLLNAPPLGISAGAVPAVPKDAVGRTALLNLLRSNLEMFSVYVDRCYDGDARIATASFQVASEVYSLHQVKVEPHVVLSLVLYKMVDGNQEVREDAMHMLQVLSMREWQTSATDLASAATAAGARSAAGQHGAGQDADGHSGSVLVLGALQDSYQQFQYELAVSLARDRPELSEALCEEMMTRQLELADKVSQHPVLTCLSPWMENLTIAAHWKGTWCERLLKSMYYVTLRHGDELPLEIERLWRTLAHNRRNIIPMLDFLASLGTHMSYQQELPAMLEYLGVSKRICLYLARKNAQQTIDHLVYEVSLQLLEDEGSAAGASSGGNGAGGYQQQRHAPLEFAAVLQQPADTSSPQRPADRQQPAADAAGSSFAAAPPALRSSFGSWWSQNVANSSLPTVAPAQQDVPAAAGTPTGAAGSGQVQGGQLVQQQGMRLSSSLSSSLGVHDAGVSVGGSGHGSSSRHGRDSLGGLADLRDSSQGLGASSGALGSQGGAPGMRASADQSDASSVSSVSVSGAGATPGSMSGTEQQLGMPAGVAGSSSSLGGLSGAASSAVATPGPVWETSNGPTAGAAAGSGSYSGPGFLTNWSSGGAVGAAPGASPGPSAAAAGPAGVAGLNLSSYFGSRPTATGLLSGHRGSGVAAALQEEAAWLSAAGGIGRNSPRPTREPPSPALRGLVTRPELALCLLTEVVYEHDEDVSSHLALLCHVCLLLADHEEHLVAAAAQQLLINCLYSLSHHYRDLMQEEHKPVDTTQASALIKYVQSMRGRRLWPSEDIGLDSEQGLASTAALANMVQHCLDAFNFEPGLKQGWVSVSLDWALHARSRHLACRSQQVLRSLQPQLTGDMCAILLLCLQQCLATAEGSSVARDVALELLLTLRELLEALPARKLLLYPQVFWASLSLLFSSYVSIYKQGLLLLTACIQQLPMHDSTIQNILLAAAPSGEPGRLQQLLAHCHRASTAQHSMRAPSPDLGVAAAAVGSTAGKSRYATAPAGHSGTADSATSTLKGAAFREQPDVASSFVGGVGMQGGQPMPWPFAQLLPWPERGPDGPAHHMVAVQQLLFKGLLFPQTQLQTVHLFTLLAQGLCQLPPGAPRPIQAPAAAGGLDAVSRGSASRERDQLAGGSLHASLEGSFQGHRASGSRLPTSGAAAAGTAAGGGSSSTSSSRSTSRTTTGTPSGHRASRESLGGPGRTTSSGAGSDAVMRSSAGGALGPGELSARARAARFWQQQEQASPSSPRQLERAAAGGEDGAAVSSSAPELRGLRGRRSSGSTAAGADAAEAQLPPQQQQHGSMLQSSCSMFSSLMRAGNGSSGAALSHSSRRLPGTRAAFQCILGQRHAQLLVSVACIVPFFCSQLGQLEPDSELLQGLQECMHALAAACCTHGFAPLGSRLQLFADALNVNSGSGGIAGSGLLVQLGGSSSNSSGDREQQQQPLHAARHVQFSGAAVGGGQPGSPQGKQRLSGLSAGLGDSSSSSVLYGSSFQQQWQAGGLPGHVSSALLQLMQPLCLQLARALLPTFAESLLRLWMGLLLLPGAAHLHPHVLLLLRCLFDSPGLQLGPAACLLLDSSFLSPVVTLAQGPLCQHALDALESIINYAANSPDLQQQQQQGAGPSAGLGTAAAAAAATPGSGPGVDLQGLAACCLPQLDLVELLRRVLESFGSPPRKRRQRLLPFLADSSNSAGHTQTERMLED